MFNTQTETSAEGEELWAYSTATTPSGDTQVPLNHQAYVNAMPMFSAIPVFSALRYTCIRTLGTGAVSQTHQLGLRVELYSYEPVFENGDVPLAFTPGSTCFV